MPNRRRFDDLYHKQRRTTWIGLLVAIILDTAAQSCWKAATFHVPVSADMWQTLMITFRQPLFHMTLLLIIVMFFNWMIVLSHADLSYAQPITALSYVTISVVAVALFGEHISLQRMLGITMILLGVWCVSGTSHRTVGRNAGSQCSPAQTKERL
jgi:multidrug transporter EmrE-like cation transporter